MPAIHSWTFVWPPAVSRRATSTYACFKLIFKKICIGSDHAGYKLKEFIKDFLIKKNVSIIDLGPNDENSVDYPDYAKKVSKRVKSGKSEVGILAVSYTHLTLPTKA